MAGTYEERFRSKIDKGPGCWEWQAGRDDKDYGRFCLDGKSVLAHRLSYELDVEPIPEDLCVLHRCDNPGCVNPEHLFLGTQQDNIQDMIDKGRKVWRKPPTTRGEDSPVAKLVESQVHEIRSLFAEGWGRKDIGDAYGIAEPSVTRIGTRKSWAHVAEAI